MSLINALAWLAWGLAIVFTTANLRYPNIGLGALAVMFAAGAATLHTRGAIDGLERRLRNAFDAGRAYEQGRVRQLR